MGKANQQTQMTSDLHILHLKIHILLTLVLLSPSSVLSIVIESKLVLLTTGQENKLRQVLGKAIMNLSGKPANQEDGGLMPQRTTLPELESRLLLY